MGGEGFGMAKKQVWSGGVGIVLLVSSAWCPAQKSMTLGTVTGTDVTVPITMTSDEDVLGFELSISFNTDRLAAVDLRAAGASLTYGAGRIVPEILPGGAILQVEMDPLNETGNVIPAGSGRLIAEVDLFVLI